MLKPSPKAEMSPSVIIIDNQKLSKVTWTATSRSYILIYNMEYLRVRSQFNQHTGQWLDRIMINIINDNILVKSVDRDLSWTLQYLVGSTC